MFSGIVTHQGTIAALETGQVGFYKDWRITIETDLPRARCSPGASIACNGTCLTVAEVEQVHHGKSRFVVQVAPTTRGRTTIPEWKVGRRVNLESSLRLGDPLDGHLVTGHVDACVKVARRIERENEIALDFSFPTSEDEAAQQLRTCCAVRGSVALDGVSLTVSACSEKTFSVAIVPYTAKHTTLGAVCEGERVNLEVDLLARYVTNMVTNMVARRTEVTGDKA